MERVASAHTHLNEFRQINTSVPSRFLKQHDSVPSRFCRPNAMGRHPRSRRDAAVRSTLFDLRSRIQHRTPTNQGHPQLRRSGLSCSADRCNTPQAIMRSKITTKSATASYGSSNSAAAAAAPANFEVHSANQAKPFPTPGSTSPFCWERNWWPAIPVSYLDPSRPTPVEILGRHLVMWQDAQGMWRCFGDECPHRLAPLSEGRVEGGELMCSYHGWRFNGTGGCTAIPQAGQEKELLAAQASPRSCATAYPTQVKVGLLWVWMDPNSEEESRATPPPTANMAEQEEMQPVLDSGRWMMRDMPYDYDILVENLVDPSHLPFAHHKMMPAVSRYNAKPLPFHPETMDPTSSDGTTTGAAPVTCWGYPGIGGGNARVSFFPPSLVTYLQVRPHGKNMVTQLYAVPSGPGRCRLIVLALDELMNAKDKPMFLRVFELLPTWFFHTAYHTFLDGDSSFLYTQGTALRAKEREREVALASVQSHGGLPETGDGARPAWSEAYFMPMKCDRAVVDVRKWLSAEGGGGPAFAPGAIRHIKLEQKDRLDRYLQHTRHCPHCQKGMGTISRVSNIAKVALAALFVSSLTLILKQGPVGFLKSGMVPAAILVAVAVVAAINLCGHLLKQFHYVEFSHADNH